MARPLREGSRAEPPAALPGHPACRGGPLALPAPLCRGPLAAAPRLSCACPGAPPAAAAAAFALYRCAPGRRDTPAARAPAGAGAGAGAAGARGEFQATEDDGLEGEDLPAEPTREAAVPNGHVPGEPPSLEQELGARLRSLGDAFQRAHEQQHQEHRRRGAFWGHVYHFVSQLLGALYNLQGDALPAQEPN
ncbi:bcl-2-binding component 3-like [Dromaius novaehollandiae]|uniref:bcl-2-binding component 3-like n=1 Tax=Dromaius novaehollandiae TaxID=8790 RepID=UPI00311EEBD3